jgi:hypothetical protein
MDDLERRWIGSRLGRDGRELLYRSGDRMMSVTTTLKPTFNAGKPVALFPHQYLKGEPFRNYDVGRDGPFLMLKPTSRNVALTQLNVVLNWQEELKQRVRPD